MIWWILLMVVAVLIGPFAAVRAVSAFRTARRSKRAPAKANDELDEDGKPKSSGFW